MQIRIFYIKYIKNEQLLYQTLYFIKKMFNLFGIHIKYTFFKLPEDITTYQYLSRMIKYIGNLQET